MRHVLILVVTLCCCTLLPAQTPQGCYTDEMHQHLAASDHPRPVPATAKTDADAGFEYVIPVVFHVMEYNGIENNVTTQHFIDQLEALNACFNRYAADQSADPRSREAHIRFCLAQTDPEGNPHPGWEWVRWNYTGAFVPSRHDTVMKKMCAWPTDRYLNVYIVRTIVAGGLFGYSYYPEEVAGVDKYDGIVLALSHFGVGGTFGSGQGKTLVHEAGHYLGLYHPWGKEGGCGDTDECEDTPPVDGAYYAAMPWCNSPAACDGSIRMNENFMDYAADPCQNLFTNCQVDRMRTTIPRYRSRLVSGENIRSTGCGLSLDTLAVQDSLFMYPNPARDILMLNLNYRSASGVSIVIYNFMGQKALEMSLPSGEHVIPVDLKLLAAGKYVVQVTTERGVERRVLLRVN